MNYPSRYELEQLKFPIHSQESTQVYWMLRMHDALDAKDAELAKAKDLIKRMASFFGSGQYYSSREAYAGKSLVDEAEAMTKEG